MRFKLTDLNARDHVVYMIGTVVCRTPVHSHARIHECTILLVQIFARSIPGEGYKSLLGHVLAKQFNIKLHLAPIIAYSKNFAPLRATMSFECTISTEVEPNYISGALLPRVSPYAN